ncbi:7115_t:CDS:2, partial [Dentiscutata erythropus]
PNQKLVLAFNQDLETKSHLLVLEYAGNGNLNDYLSENKNLTWPQKIKISKDIACGLKYLHDNIKMIHRNLNTKTIIINNDKAQILNPVFLELNADTSSYMTLQEGIGFIDPELLKDLNSQFTKSSDIYSLDPIKDTPQTYIDLYLKCWKLNSKERPSAQDVYIKLTQIEKTLRESLNIGNGERTVMVQDTTTAVTQNDNYFPVKVFNEDGSNNPQKGLLD